MGPLHPDLNALAAFADRRLPDAERATMFVHLGGCAECRAILATYARGQELTAVRDESPAVTRSRTRFRPAVWLPIAATLALVTTGGWLAWRTAAPIAPEPAPRAIEAPAPVTPPAQAPAPVPGRPPVDERPPSRPDPLATRRSADRVVNGKMFRLVAGEWIDSAYDPVALLPVQDIAGPDARTSLLERMPSLAQYAALGPRVIVVFEGVVYRFRP
jgi:anti-sigma factor RsiW